MSKMKAVVAFVVLLCTAATAGAQHQATQGTYRIGPGDVLDVVVWRNQELSMQVTVRPDGWISFPLINDVQVAGGTATDVQKKLAEALGKFVTTPMLTVVVTHVAPMKVSIIGKVRQPGRYAVDAPATVLDVLALAGGPTDYADPERMYRTAPRRRARRLVSADPCPGTSSSISGGPANTNIAVGPGDIVVVP